MGHIGKQWFETDIWEGTPTTMASAAYAAKDLIGTQPISFTDGENAKCTSGRIRHVTVADKAAQSANLDLVFLSCSPLTSTFTNNSVLALADSDLYKTIGVCHVTDHTALSDNGISQGDCNVPFQLQSGNSLYGLLMSQGTPTYATVSDLLIRLGIEKD